MNLDVQQGLDKFKTGARYWIVQHIADAAQRNQWTHLEPERKDAETKIQSTGGSGVGRPKALQALIPEHPVLGGRALTAYIGLQEYQRALWSLDSEEFAAILLWMRRQRLKGRYVTAPALFRSQGERVIRGENTTKVEQDAALNLFQSVTVFNK